MKIVLTLIVCLLTPLSAMAADYRYVTDQFKIMMRTGESSGHKIKRTVSSGTRLEVLSSNQETGYSMVRLASGVEGFVLTRQLQTEPVAREQLKTANERLAELQAAPDELTARLTSLQQEHGELLQKHEVLEREKNNLEQELSGIKRTASNAIRVTNERNELRMQVTELTRELENLKQENRELSNDTAQDWFIIGAGVVIAGIILGLILPHLRVQRRRSTSSWDSF